MTSAAPSAKGLGEYPTRYDVPALRGRRQLYALRYLTWFAVVATLVASSVEFAAVAIVPLKSAEPTIAVNTGIKDGVFQVDGPDQILPGDALLIEKSVVDYVLARNRVTSDDAEMTHMWGEDGLISGLEGQNFVGSPASGKASITALVGQIKAGQYQDVVFRGSKPLVLGSAYQVDFDAQPVNGAGTPTGPLLKQRGYVQISFDSAKPKTLDNPLGIVVEGYNDQPRRE